MKATNAVACQRGPCSANNNPAVVGRAVVDNFPARASAVRSIMVSSAAQHRHRTQSMQHNARQDRFRVSGFSAGASTPNGRPGRYRNRSAGFERGLGSPLPSFRSPGSPLREQGSERLHLHACEGRFVVKFKASSDFLRQLRLPKGGRPTSGRVRARLAKALTPNRQAGCFANQSAHERRRCW